MQDTRKSESSPVTVTTQTSAGVFETISRMLTIRNATKSDSGIYVCNVIDFSGHTFTVAKYIDIQSILNSGSINFSHRNLLFTFISFLYVYCYSRY